MGNDTTLAMDKAAVCEVKEIEYVPPYQYVSILTPPLEFEGIRMGLYINKIF